MSRPELGRLAQPRGQTFDDGVGRIGVGHLQFRAVSGELRGEALLHPGEARVAIDIFHFLRIGFQVEQFPLVYILLVK